MNNILAIVLNWNELDLTRRCIRSLLDQKMTACDVLVVDNHSDEETVEILRNEFSGIPIHRNTRNLGVSAGRNIGIGYALRRQYGHVLLFDNDAIADPYMLHRLSESAERHPQGGIFGPKIYYDDSSRIIWRAGCTSWKWTYLHAGHTLLKRFYQLFGRPLPMAFDSIRGENQSDRGQFDTEEDIDFQIGCAQLIKTDVFKAVGLLDEEFSPYGSEDIDFCIRAKGSGWRIRYVPTAICRHRVGGSFQDEYQRTYCNTRHILLLARKHLRPIYFWLLYLPDFLCLTLPLMLAESVFQKKKERLKAIVDAIAWHLSDIKLRGLHLSRKRAFTSLPEHKTDGSGEA